MIVKTLVLVFSLIASNAIATPVASHDKSTVVSAVIKHLNTDYVDAELGNIAAIGLENAWTNGAFNGDLDGPEFAKLLSAELQELTGDGHLNVEYSSTPIADTKKADEEYSAQEMERWYGAHINFGVQKIERLEPNIGLLDLRVFSPPGMGGQTVVAALNVLANTDALIIDLRQNGGGIGYTVTLVASYLFDDEPQPLSGIYNRPTDTLTRRFTHTYMAGARYGPDKPVYILISRKTFSAAEALAYDLQALKRATIVGEPSGGGANPFEYRRVHENFVLWSVTEKSVNPITNGNWQGVGVQPDIAVPSERALEAALEDLRSRQGLMR